MTEAKGFLIGGIVSREILAELEHFLMPLPHALNWQHATNDTSLFLLTKGNNVAYREDMDHVLVALGHVAYPQKEIVAGEVLEEIKRHYRTHKRFPVDWLEGSFALVLLDKVKDIVIIYRNILGLPPIYYSQTQKGMIFSDSLSFLARVVSDIQKSQTTLNSSQLPAHLMFGGVPSRNTLFKGIFRIMPGEQVAFNGNSLTFLQLQTFDSMIGRTIKNCVESLECVMRKVINEYARTYPQIGNFFSGGVDSSYIQAHLAGCLDCTLPTFSVDLIHASWKKEHEYAKSGSEFFKSHQTFVEVDPLTYPSLLINATAILGQPICHAQTVFVPVLSRAAVQNTSVCLCGMAADALFGTETGRHIDISFQISKLIPWNFLRQIMMRIAGILSKTHQFSDQLGTFQECLRLDLVNNSSPMHPFNTSHHIDLKLMFNIFGRRGVTTAMSERRDVLNQYQVTGSLKERFHSLDLLTMHQVSEQFYQLASYAGLKIIFPYLDSRIVKTALSMNGDCRFPHRQTKKVLKDALGRYLPKELIYRTKSAWGVPVVEWLGSGGVLFPLVEKINEYPFLEGKTSVVKKTQDWFLWNLLTFDLWHKLFIDRNARAR